MALHNDPKVRHEKYQRQRTNFQARHHEGGMAPQRRAESVSNSIAGGAAWQAMQLNPDGTTDRGQAEECGTSIFDPVLCELTYRWFCPPKGIVLDPFAGGSVRGIVASALDRQYVGIELREEQVHANREQADRICKDPMPVWHCADSLTIPEICSDLNADLVFTCPPYGDLEIYSDDPRDISTMPHEECIATFKKIICGAVARLKEDRFAVCVVGEFRDHSSSGFYRNFVSDTIAAFQGAGAKLYNEAILVTSLGSLPIRAARPFESGRKLGKTHQNVLVFCKGDPIKATQAIGKVEVEWPIQDASDPELQQINSSEI